MKFILTWNIKNSKLIQISFLIFNLKRSLIHSLVQSADRLSQKQGETGNNSARLIEDRDENSNPIHPFQSGEWADLTETNRYQLH